jgi:hypothetical protein
MATTYTDNMYAIHTADSGKVKQLIEEAKRGEQKWWETIKVRRIDGYQYIVDGVHRAVAAQICSVPAPYEEVGENELLSDSDIKSMRCRQISRIANETNW